MFLWSWKWLKPNLPTNNVLWRGQAIKHFARQISNALRDNTWSFGQGVVVVKLSALTYCICFSFAAMNVTYNSTQCQPSCYVSCSASCEPVCCSPDNSQSFYGYEIISFPATSPPPPPPPSPLPSPVYVQSQHIQPSAYQSAYSSYCPQVCSQQCLPTCPRVCCTQVNVMAQFSRRRGK